MPKFFLAALVAIVLSPAAIMLAWEIDGCWRVNCACPLAFLLFVTLTAWVVVN